MIGYLLSLIPGDNWRKPDLPHAREERQCGEDYRSNDELIFVQDLYYGVGTCLRLKMKLLVMYSLWHIQPLAKARKCDEDGVYLLLLLFVLAF